jgi:hypothetical protein
VQDDVVKQPVELAELVEALLRRAADSEALDNVLRKGVKCRGSVREQLLGDGVADVLDPVGADHRVCPGKQM